LDFLRAQVVERGFNSLFFCSFKNTMTTDTQSELEPTVSEDQDTNSELDENSDSSDSENSQVTVDDLVEHKFSKEEKREINAQRIAEKEAEKLIQGIATEEEIPTWVREKAVEIAKSKLNQEQKEDKIAELESKLQSQINELKAEKLKRQQAEDDKRAKETITKFLKGYDISPKEFDAQYGTQYFSEVKRLMSIGHTKSEATKYALSDLMFEFDRAEKEFDSQTAGMSIPTSGKRTEKGSKTKLTQRQIELAEKFGNDPNKVY